MHGKRLLGSALALVVAGCSSANAPSGPCAPRHGTYRIDFASRSGDCGTIPEGIFVIPALADSGTNQCTGGSSFSADNCIATIDETCPAAAAGGVTDSLREVGDVTWDAAGSSAHGIVSMTLRNPDNSVNCVGSYDVTYTRQ